MDETQSAAVTMYWCHMCNRRVEPVIEVETIECPLCQSGFIEQMNPTISSSTEHLQIPDGFFLHREREMGPDSDSALSLWAPVLLGMMSNPRRRRRFQRRLELEYEDNDDILNNFEEGGETELDRELQSFVRTRRRNSAQILQFLQGIRSGEISQSIYNPEIEHEHSGRDTTEIRDRNRNRVILINPLNQAIVLQSGNLQNRNINYLGDYFVGPGLDLLLQHLAENDPNRYGTPPAEKEAVEAMPTVKINENMQCSVCLEDLEMGTEAKEMPCQHKFHSGCIFPWLKLHSSCPVCRYQLPSDGCKINGDNNMGSHHNDNSSSSNGRGAFLEEGGMSESRRGFSIPWPFSNLFSSSGNRGSSSSSSNNAMGNTSSTDEN